MKLYQGTSKHEKSLSYLSMDRIDEDTITRVITRYLRKVEAMTLAEQDLVKDLLRGFIFSGKSMTVYQYQDMASLASRYRIRFALDISTEPAESKDQYGHIPAKRRLGIMERELRAAKYEGKWTRKSVLEFLSGPTQEEQEAIGVPASDFLSKVESLCNECFDEAHKEILRDVREETNFYKDEPRQIEKKLAKRICVLEREVSELKRSHKLEMDDLRDSLIRTMERKLEALRTSSEQQTEEGSPAEEESHTASVERAADAKPTMLSVMRDTMHKRKEAQAVNILFEESRSTKMA
jgi:hypothetical protein